MGGRTIRPRRLLKPMATLLASVLLAGSLGVGTSFGAEEGGSTVTPGDGADDRETQVIDPSEIYSEELLQYIPHVPSYVSYDDYLATHEGAGTPSQAIELDLRQAYGDLKSVEDASDRFEGVEDLTEPVTDFEWTGDALHTLTKGVVHLPFTAEETGLYELEVEYQPLDGSGTAIERRIELDGEVPYEEASIVMLPRVYVDKNQDYKEVEENQTFPSQVEARVWMTRRFHDMNGYYREPLKFYLERGEHVLTLSATKEPMALRRISFRPPRDIPSYSDYIAEHQAHGAEIIDTVGEPLHIQGEDATYKSTPSFYPLNDRTSPLTEPYHPTYVRLNTIGGASWGDAGEWLSWDVEVPRSGFYRIAFRYRQDMNTGNYSTRILRVNGDVPFEEARSIRFPYDSAWQTMKFEKEDGSPYYIYLEAGTNRLSLEVSLDRFAEIIHEVENIAQTLNGVAQDIVVITSTSPDRYRDYQLTERLPDMLPTMRESRDALLELIRRLYAIMGGRSDKTATLEKAELQLTDMIDKPETIAAELNTLQSNITGLGNWALQIKSQSLTLDYIALLGEEDPEPRARAGFFRNVWHEIQAFIGSFTNNMDERTTGEAGETEDVIEVWVTTGRDQMDVISRLLNDSFDPTIQVNLRLVASAVALSATAAGRGPDVLIQTDSAQPIDFAFRESALDLTQFEDFDEVAEWVHPAALGAFEFEGGYYALPDQMSFPVLFYRADILSELQIPVPQTWEDIITIVPFLQNNNMEFFMEVASAPTLGAATQSTTKAINPVYLSMLYQTGGELYNDAGTRALTDSPESLQAFDYWTDYYTKHSFPVSVDFVTRFRLGSVPLAIVNFTNYTTLSVSAPEIRGDWGIAPVPGTRREDGSLDRALPATTSAAMIVRPSVESKGNAEAAWTFIKWWVSADTQTSFASEMESLLGSSARYPVANLESFDLSPWPTQAMDVLQASLAPLREVRQVPGSYITGRNIENAFYEVVNEPESANTRRSLVEWTVNTNEEITSKRQEFGLDIYEGGN